MPFDYEVSAALLSEIWSALRVPVTPWEPATAGEAITECIARACRLGREHIRACLESILFRAAGNYEFASETRAELLQLLGMLSRPGLGRRPDGQSHPAALPEASLAGMAAFCMKLEMFGFEIDSGPVCEAAQAELRPRCKQSKTAAPLGTDAKRIEERLKKHIVMRAGRSRRQAKVHTLRTHRGFIIQAHLGRDLEPVRLDVFGPKYNMVSDWMNLLSADGAWSLELRDALGYDPCAVSAIDALPRNAGRVRKSG